MTDADDKPDASFVTAIEADIRDVAALIKRVEGKARESLSDARGSELEPVREHS